MSDHTDDGPRAEPVLNERDARWVKQSRVGAPLAITAGVLIVLFGLAGFTAGPGFALLFLAIGGVFLWYGFAVRKRRARLLAGEQVPDEVDADADPAAERPWWKRPWGIAGILFVLFVAVGAMSGDDENRDGEPAGDIAAEASSEDEPEPAEEAPSDVEPEPKPEPDEEATGTASEPESFEERVAVALGDSNRDIKPPFTITENSADDGGMEVVVTWAIDDNLTDNLVRRGAQLNATRILEAVANSPDLEYHQVFLVGTFSMVDQLGNAEEKNVIGATYPRATVEAINFDNFLTENAWNIANQDSLYIHPAFQPEN